MVTAITMISRSMSESSVSLLLSRDKVSEARYFTAAVLIIFSVYLISRSLHLARSLVDHAKLKINFKACSTDVTVKQVLSKYQRNRSIA